ncbi:hypothetical protein KAW18_01815 [candidate division WOR-3 bacterium]|nr:hypothetical protein [candidate division WOR-3 bacterium]
MMKEDRKFDKKVYGLYSGYTKKKDAVQVANSIRKDGGLARIVKSGKYWYVYEGLAK